MWLQKILLILFISGVLINHSQAQTCNCPALQLLVYDFDYRPVTPAWYNGEIVDTPKYSQRQVYEFYIWAESPAKGSQSFLQAVTEANPGINFHKSNFLPEHDKDSVSSNIDYIVSGTYLPLSDHYNLKITVEDPRNKEKIIETSVEFNSMEDITDAAGNAAKKLSPLLESIRNYQHKIRDQKYKDKTAIHAMYELSAADTELKTNDSTEISLKLFDCDDNSPLRYRKVLLKLSNGASTISPAIVTTDDKGAARAIFKSGKKAEIITVYPVYQYTSVINKKLYATPCTGELRIDVADDGDKQIKEESTNKKVKWHITVRYDERVNMSSASKTNVSSSGITKAASLDMYVLSDPLEKNGYILLNPDHYKILSARVSGDFHETGESKKDVGDGYEYRKDEYSGVPNDKDPGFVFEYDPAADGVKLFQAFIPFNKTGTYDIERTSKSEPGKWHNTVDEPYGSSSATIGNSNDKILRTKTGFIIDGGDTKNKEEDNLLFGHTTEKGFTQYHITITRE